jgi:hypothetical protein
LKPSQDRSTPHWPGDAASLETDSVVRLIELPDAVLEFTAFDHRRTNLLASLKLIF